MVDPIDGDVTGRFGARRVNSVSDGTWKGEQLSDISHPVTIVQSKHSPEVIRHPLDLKDLTFRQRVLMFAKPNLDRVA
jgi:hypothetical protein